MDIRLGFIGTGTCNSTLRTPQSLALTDGTSIVMVDAGGGFYHRLGKLAPEFPRYDTIDAVILTHYHVDHVSGLPDLLWGEMWDAAGTRGRPLIIAGPRGLEKFLKTRLLPFMGDYEIPFELVPVEFNPGDTGDFGFLKVIAVPLAHGEESTGYMIDVAGRRLAITGDTGFCDALPRFLRESDVAVIEWSFSDDRVRPKHISTADIAALLKEGALPPEVHVIHQYPDADGRIDQIRRVRDLLGGDSDRFHFPEGGEIVRISR